MRKLIVILIILHTMSCVSMKKFSSVDAMLADMRKDSIEKAKLIVEQNARIDELLRRNIALGRDTLRLFSDYTNLLEKFERTSEENRQEIVRLSAQLYGTSRKINNAGSGGKVSKMATSITKSVNNFGEELRKVLRNENKELYSIDTKNWDLVITLHDSLLYVPMMDNGKLVYDHNRLSRNGEYLLSKLSSMIVEKDNFDVVVREYISINSPNLRFIPNAKSDEITSLNKEAVVAVLDTLMVRGVVSLNTMSAKPDDTTFSNNAVINVEHSHRLDSIKAAQEAERIKQIELDRMAEIVRLREREKRRAADRTTVIMRALMKNTYANLGQSKISRDVSYVKVDNNVKLPDNECVEIILKPNITELYNIIKDIENRNK